MRLASSRLDSGARLDPHENRQVVAERDTGAVAAVADAHRRLIRRATHFVAGCIWFFILVFVLGVIYPPAAAAFACAVTTAACVAWFLLWVGSRR